MLKPTNRKLRAVMVLAAPMLLVSTLMGAFQPSALRSPSTVQAMHADMADMAGVTMAQVPNPVDIQPPTGLQLVALDSTIHATWTPSTDSGMAWQLVTVWDGNNMQQSKVVSRTSRAAQANGVIPGRTYTVKVQSMDAQGGLSAAISGVTTTDPQLPMMNNAFFDSFDVVAGALDYNYFDVRTSQGNDQRPPDVDEADKFLAFGSEHHFHTEMIGGRERGELYIRPRVPVDLSDNITRTFQTEFDVATTQHSEGKWPEIHFVDANHVPWSSEEFGAGNGIDWPNSITFSVRGDQGGSTSNFPMIETNIGGVQHTYIGSTPIFNPANIRMPMVVKISRHAAQLFINGVLMVSATFNAQLPYTSAYWILAHRSWYSNRDETTAPVINQLVHWDMVQYDGPAGSYNPVVKTYLQPGCAGIVRNNGGSIENCASVTMDRFNPTYSMPFNVAENLSTARSAVLRFNGYSTNGVLGFNLNGHTMNLNTASSGFQNVLNSYSIPVSWLRSGSNTMTFTSTNTGNNDATIAQIELEVVYNQHRVIVPDTSTAPMHMVQITNNNFRIDHLAGDPNIYTATTYLYNIGSSSTTTYTVNVVNPKPYLTLSQSSGTLLSPSQGGGVTRLDMRFNFANVHTDDEGDVIVVNVAGGPMPVLIGILVVASGETHAPTYVSTFPMTTTFNKSAIPDYHGGQKVPHPTPTAPPNLPKPILPPN